MSKKKSPYPHRGTPAGDERIGKCAAIGCGAELRRGDVFTVLVGDILICDTCNRDGFKIKEAAMQ